MKKRLMIGAGALALVAVPAVIGLWGNASFAQTVPVRVPTSGQITLLTPSPTPSDDSTDDNGGDVPRDQRTEPGDDRDANGSTGSNPAPSPSRSSDDGDSTDDNGGDVPRDQRTEPGDDRDVNGGSDDSGSDDSSSDDSGHGSNSGSGSGSGSDDSGHGSDDSDDSDDDHGGHGEDD